MRGDDPRHLSGRRSRHPENSGGVYSLQHPHAHLVVGRLYILRQLHHLRRGQNMRRRIRNARSEQSPQLLLRARVIFGRGEIQTQSFQRLIGRPTQRGQIFFDLARLFGVSPDDVIVGPLENGGPDPGPALSRARPAAIQASFPVSRPHTSKAAITPRRSRIFANRDT